MKGPILDCRIAADGIAVIGAFAEWQLDETRSGLEVKKGMVLDYSGIDSSAPGICNEQNEAI